MDERRAMLLEHGLELFSTRAYDEVAIDDIAATANVSKGLLYHYFGGKRDFYLEVVRLASRTLLEATEPDPDKPPAMRGIEGLTAYLEFVVEHEAAFTTLTKGGLGTDPDIARIVEHTRLAMVGRLMLELGLNEPRPAFRLALRSWVGGVEAASLDWLERRDTSREHLVCLLLGQLHGAILTACALDPEAGVDISDQQDPLDFLGLRK